MSSNPLNPFTHGAEPTSVDPKSNLFLKVGGAAAAAIATILSLVMHFEGQRLTAYQDVVGVWTVCYGHTGPEVHKGMVATEAQCNVWLQQDLLKAQAIVDRCITAPMTAGQRGAFTSAVFNIGPSVVCGSTLQKLANSGDMYGACRELTNAKGRDGKEHGWTYAGGVQYKGLVQRRQAEREICWPTQSAFSNVVAGTESTAPCTTCKP